MAVASNVYDGQGNLVEQIVDHGDGTGELLRYEHGSVVETVALDGLPAPEPAPEPEPDPVVVAAETIRDEIAEALDSAPHNVEGLKAAIVAGLATAVAKLT